jgi:hypothetical protein
MFYALRQRLNYQWFNFQNRAVLSTPPLVCDPDGPFFITQLCRRDLIIYLAAVKTFGQAIRPSRVHALDDGSLTEEDRAMVRTHIPGIVFLELNNYRTPHTPAGGCWERLIAVADFCQSRYVVQLDSDTITLGDISEVQNSIKDECSFVISVKDDQVIEYMPSAVATARGHLKDSNGIQPVSEAAFDKLANHETLKYARGCAGFSGFAKGAVTREFIENISRQMYKAVGERWNEWGTEQVTSNIAVANSPKAVMLPHPKYCNCTRIRDGVTQFIHFIGYCRFKGGLYSRLVAAATSKLNAKP